MVALFGPTVRQFGFFPYNAHASVVERNLSCRPCSSHGSAECPLEHHLCMREILPDMVFTTAAPGRSRDAGGWDPAATALLGVLPQTARGPRREGIFALWLTVRVAQDLLRDPPPAERAHRRRLQALEHRLSSLTMPPPLRRALAAAISQLKEARPGDRGPGAEPARRAGPRGRRRRGGRRAGPGRSRRARAAPSSEPER